MMRVSIVASAVAAGVVSLGLLLGNLHPFGDPRVEPQKGPGPLLQSANISSDAKAVLVAKCADCHSSETRWPVYARIAPGSWLIERDIVKAREKMDLSRWDEMTADKQEVMMAKIAEETKNGDMPPLQYLALHWRATLSENDVKTLSTLGESHGSEATLTGEGDAANGKAIFERRCTGCHAMSADREGPRLAGVYGRKAGSVTNFDYSEGLKNSNWTWTDATLERWLSDPDLMVHDNKMGINVPKAKERQTWSPF